MRSKNLNIADLEEKLEDLMVQLEIAKAEELVYGTLECGFFYTVGKNTKAYYDCQEEVVVCVYDKSGRDFYFDEDEDFYNKEDDTYIEFSFDPYDILDMPACDILKFYKESGDIIEAIESECNKWFYLTEKRIEKES